MKLFIERIVTILLIFTFIIFFANQNDVQASQSTYQINTTDRYTLTGSIVDIIDEGDLISPEHYSKFYLALKEIEYNENPSLSPSAILKRYGIPYVSSSSYTNRILSRSTWKYPNFEEVDYNYIYTGGFDDDSEKKWISIEYSQVISGFMSVGTSKVLFGSKCPLEWNFVNFSGENVVCSKKTSGTSYYSPIALAAQYPIVGDQFTRYFSGDQSIYGYHISYQPKFVFEYSSLLAIGLRQFTLIDDDKLIIRSSTQEYFSINRDFHYNRNGFNDDFDDITIDSLNLSAYFHRLGKFSGDLSNSNNGKAFKDSFKSSFGVSNIKTFFPLAQSEAVYRPVGDENYLVHDSLVLGTFNFSSASKHLTYHYIYDVYPYLIWGNLLQDDSTVKERLIWDKNSGDPLLLSPWPLIANLGVFRGDLLYNHQDANIGNLIAQGFSSKILLVDRIIQHLGWNFGGYCGTPPTNPIACGEIGQPPCVVINDVPNTIE